MVTMLLQPSLQLEAPSENLDAFVLGGSGVLMPNTGKRDSAGALKQSLSCQDFIGGIHLPCLAQLLSSVIFLSKVI